MSDYPIFQIHESMIPTYPNPTREQINCLKKIGYLKIGGFPRLDGYSKLDGKSEIRRYIQNSTDIWNSVDSRNYRRIFISIVIEGNWIYDGYLYNKAIKKISFNIFPKKWAEFDKIKVYNHFVPRGSIYRGESIIKLLIWCANLYIRLLSNQPNENI